MKQQQNNNNNKLLPMLRMLGGLIAIEDMHLRLAGLTVMAMNFIVLKQQDDS